MGLQFWIWHFPGEWAALGAALLWAIAAVIYTRIGVSVPPWQLNLGKNLVAIGLLLLTIVGVGETLHNPSTWSVSLLALSGIVGIGIGDTAYFAALNHLGARRVLLLEALAPPLTAILALLWLQETLRFANWLGIGLTVLGVSWVVSEQTADTPKGHPVKGVTYALLAALGQASGAVLSRAALAQTSISPLWSALIRLAAGASVLFLVFLVQKSISSRKQTSPLSLQHRWQLAGAIAITAFFSTYLGIWLQQIALKYSPAGIAQALSATSPLFVLPLAAWTGEKLTMRAILGAILALCGIGLLFNT